MTHDSAVLLDSSFSTFGVTNKDFLVQSQDVVHSPVVDVQQPVECEVEAEGDVDGGRVTGSDGLVQRRQDRDHVGDVEDFVVLAAKAVGVESLDGHVQVQVVNWKASHMLTRQSGRVAVVAQ